MNANVFPKLSTGFGLKLMSIEGEIFSRVSNQEAVSESGNFIVVGKTIETTTSVINGIRKMLPVFTPNNIFSDKNGNSFLRAHEKTEAEVAEKAQAAGCGYIIARQQPDESFVAEAFFEGQQIDFPEVLCNELGVAYKYVDYAKYGEICKRIHGYYIAKKVEPIYVFDVEVGDKVQAVLNGVKEHETFVEEGDTVVQNMFHGETYKMKLKKLKKLYVYAETTSEGLQVWKPRDEEQTWTFTNENIFGILWGGFEFLAKAMINLTDPSDVYGCNFAVFNGDDISNGSHMKLKLFLPIMPMAEYYFETPKTLAGNGLSLGDVPKDEYMEVPLPSEVFRMVC